MLLSVDQHDYEIEEPVLELSLNNDGDAAILRLPYEDGSDEDQPTMAVLDSHDCRIWAAILIETAREIEKNVKRKRKTEDSY